ncbi:MAG TPA: hypothetical protein VNG71_02015 [Pyrinomonadaceae bacterium]|nr:hypothetical protein [Pyrinomonadaceae bacterium]
MERPVGDRVTGNDFGKMMSVRGVAPACDLSLIDLSEVADKIQTVEVERYYDTSRYHLKNIGR